MKNLLRGIFRRSTYKAGQGIRGRVHKLSIVAGGEVSIVIRCGLDEPQARHLTQGTLVEFFEAQRKPPAVSMLIDTVSESGRGGAEVMELKELGRVSETGQPSIDVLSREWLLERQRKYEQLFAEVYGKPQEQLENSERATKEVFDAHEQVTRLMDLSDAELKVLNSGSKC